MRTTINVLLAITTILFLSTFLVDAENTYVNSNFSYSQSGSSINPSFAVQVLKYEPYPVSPGESFDLWIKVQNIGRNDASNSRFVLGLNYPFSSNESLEQNYGIIFGTVNAYSSRKAGEVSSQSNEVILKYRINVNSNANPGTDYIKLTAYTDSNDVGLTFNLPIVVDKTKTEFNINLQKADTDVYSFLISNIGENNANSLSVTLEPQNGLAFLGDRIFLIGSLETGDYTKFSVPLSLTEDANKLTFDIDYTDTSGSRRSVKKEVSLEGISSSAGETKSIDKPYIKWIYAFFGFIAGIIAMFFVKRKQIKNLSR